MNHDRSQVNTFGLLRAVRDDETLSSSDKLTLHTLATYLPTVHPSVKTLARGAALDVKTVRRSIKRLVAAGWLQLETRAGRTTLYTLTPTKRHPYQKTPVVQIGYTQTTPVHPYQTTPDEETKKRSINNTSEDTRITAAATQAQVAGDKGEDAPQQRLAAWRDVWREVIGDSPLPSLAELRRVMPGLTEAHFSAHLGAVATAKAAGTVRVPRSLFFSRLKESRGEPAPAAWSKEQVLAAQAPAPLTSPPDLRRPELRRHVVKPKPVVTPEERAKRIAAMRKATAELWGTDGAGGDT
jgi:DNA-binding MarR family transcriptional regulator